MRVISKVFLSILAIGIVFVAGVLGFMALPINWEIGSIWISWSAMLQNGALVVVAIVVSWLALRAIWRTSKKEASSGSDAPYPEGSKKGSAR